jgi:hypothetical protein
LAPSLKAAFWPSLPAALGMALGLALALPWLRSAIGSGVQLLPGLIFLGALAYAALLLALGFLGEDERAQWRRLLNRA